MIIAQVLVSVTFAGWLGQHYLVRLGPYFGQRHVIEAFYRERAHSAEPLVAYRLNWKGENFYTGNHLAIFVSGGATLRKYVSEQTRGGRVLHVVLETSRLAALRAELGPTRHVEVLTDPRASDKICLVRVYAAPAVASGREETRELMSAFSDRTSKGFSRHGLGT